MANGLDANALSVLAGQLAGAIAPGTTGAALGGIGAQMAQSKVLAQEKQGQQQQLLQLVNQLTGEGAETTGLTVGEGGELKFTGKVAPRTDEAQVQSSLDTQSAPAQGGGNQTANPFFNLLGTLDSKASLA